MKTSTQLFPTLEGHEDGFFLGGSLFDDVTPDLTLDKEEIFGPVLIVVRAADCEEALRLPSEHEYGNGVAIFTRDGDAARDFAARVNTDRASPRRGARSSSTVAEPRAVSTPCWLRVHSSSSTTPRPSARSWSGLPDTRHLCR